MTPILCAWNKLADSVLMRTKYGEYPEYHTSHDDLYRVVTPQGLAGGYRAIRLCLEVIERDGFPVCQIIGEPQLKRSLQKCFIPSR